MTFNFACWPPGWTGKTAERFEQLKEMTVEPTVRVCERQGQHARVASDQDTLELGLGSAKGAKLLAYLETIDRFGPANTAAGGEVHVGQRHWEQLRLGDSHSSP